MKRWLLVVVAVVVILLPIIAACAPKLVLSTYPPKAEEATRFSWTDNGVNAVYFPWFGESFVNALGDWQQQNPNKEIITPPGPVPDIKIGYTVFYRFKK
ncbi:MAG: hypothetical protein Q7R84_02865 [bacterium]|nr:hypothetical protein [bacterium]